MHDVTSNTIESSAPATPTRVRGRKRGALLSLLVSGGLIYLLYRTLNLRQVGEALLTADRVWLRVYSEAPSADFQLRSVTLFPLTPIQ